MSARRSDQQTNRFARLLLHPPNAPLVHVARRALPTAAPKREREPDPLDGFDPYEEPETCLRRYCAVQLAVQQLADRDRRADARRRLDQADILLLSFVAEQAAASTVIGDVETTTLIASGTPIGSMVISVATLMFVEESGTSFTLSFWSDEALGRGAPLRFLLQAVDNASKLVFYNARFDLTVIARGNEDKVDAWTQKTLDPYRDLRDAFGANVRLKLDTLLRDNGLAPKTADGIEAVRFYAQGRYDELEAYNVDDVRALRALVELPRIRLSDGQYTTIGTLPRPSDPRSLKQGSPAWFAYRKGKIGASMAPAFVRRDFRLTRDEAFERLIGAGDGDADTTAMARGRQQEPLIAARYARERRVRVQETGAWPHPQYGAWLFASPDRLVREGTQLGLLEIKSMARVPETPTDAQLIQVQLQLACCPDAEWADLALAAGDLSTLRVFRVRRDSDLIRLLLGHLRAVYRAAQPVLAGRLPAEQAFVDDVQPFERANELELTRVLGESRALFVS
jgi:hypothetical protein